jgi:hypothetical protein
MKVLALLRPPEGTDVRSAIAAHAADELSALWRLYSDGTVREMYSPAGPGAVLILETGSLDLARSALQTLPLLATEVMVLDVFELRPFAAFEILFSRRSGR